MSAPDGDLRGRLHPFELDPFQVRALDALDAGRSVLVAAPTGSGKTVVAEYAVARALAGGGKAFYTTPIKALSNQKFGDLARRHGAGRVGLLTGDNAINGDAPAVVMTTEVLRNMIYAGSPALRDLRYVVLDEVHYLQDSYRGPVWEEVIIHLPPEVRLVCLSATVSNAEELAEWLTTVRGPTDLVLEQERPVELRNLYLVGDRRAEEPLLLPTLVDGRPNPEAERIDEEASRTRPGGMRGRDREGGRGRAGRDQRRPRRKLFTPRRPEIIDLLDDREMLPALYFIFSRAACEDAVAACLDAGLRLTTPEERARVHAIVDERTASLGPEDLGVLGFDRWLAALGNGIAAHHAGMVPPFKEAVEACFVEGLVKAVFATETLALGVNMPARSVVIERLTKFDGETRAFLTPAEYTQLTGRAGRRGIDDLGYALVPWSPFVSFEQVANLAASRSYALRSAFRPTYNMAANLVRRYDAGQAHHLLNLSFAQFQADRAVVRVETRIERVQERIDRLDAEAQCDLGDVEEYLALRQAEGDARRAAAPPRGEVEAALAALAPGDVVDLGGARVAVLSVAQRKGGVVKVRGLGTSGEQVTFMADDLDVLPRTVGHIDAARPYVAHDKGAQRHVVNQLRRGARGTNGRNGRNGRSGRDDRNGRHGDGRGRDGKPGKAERAAIAAHPVHDCPDRDRHLRSLAQRGRAQRELEGLEREVRSRTESLARRFDRVLRLLGSWGHLDGWALTAKGEVLARTYHESDLLVAEAMTSGLLDGLDPASLAGLVSCFTYEHRGPGPAPAPWFPSKLVRTRWQALEDLSERLRDDEEAAGLPPTRAPDPGFVALAHAWAAGEGLGEVLDDEDLSGGDFVRTTKSLLDLLHQVGQVAPDPATARAARRAADAIHRGVVSASSSLDEIVRGDAAAAGGDGDGRAAVGTAGGDGDGVRVEMAEEPAEPAGPVLPTALDPDPPAGPVLPDTDP